VLKIAHQTKTFENLKKIDSKIISEKTNDIHVNKLYAGYVNKRNEIEEKVKTADKSKAAATYSEFGELKRQETFNANGMILHEVFFPTLGGNGKASGPILHKIEKDFGSFDAWKEDFVATALSARGWSVLAFDPSDGKLHNYLVDFHHFGGVWGCTPLLVMDVFEHAYMIDYGADRKTYVHNVLGIVNWEHVNQIITKHKLF